MPKAIGCVCLILLSLVLPTSAAAQVAPPIVNRPAATLLLPYFEVDLDNAEGQTTLFSVNNASATAMLAHVTLWSDLGVPVFAFNVYLTGYDIQTFNLRDVILGTVPTSASDGQDPQDRITPQGPLSQDINFASCTGVLPPPPVPPVYQPYLRAALTGNASSFHEGMCVARNHGTPAIARGYVTVDTVNRCTLLLPGEPGYFSPGFTGDTTGQNVLWGDYTLVDQSKGLVWHDALVHITAGATPELSDPGQYTFYGALTNWTAADGREPLATTFATRYVSAKDFKTTAKARQRNRFPPATELIVWRDPKVSVAPFACGGTPSWYPLGLQQVRAFDEQEETEEVTFSVAPFPGVTQRVVVGTADFPVSFSSGWLFLNLNTAVAPGNNPPENQLAAQAWVSVLHRVQQGPNGGRYDVGYRAIRLDSAQATPNVTLP